MRTSGPPRSGGRLYARLLAVTLIWISVATALVSRHEPALAAVAADAKSPVELLAVELLSQLRKNRAGRRVAIWPFSERDDLPISLDKARNLNDDLLSALIRLSEGRRYSFIAGHDLRTVIRELAESGGVENPVAVVAPYAVADVLIIGKLSYAAGQIKLRYNALGVSSHRVVGETMAATSARAVFRAGQPHLSFEQAIRRAASTLGKGAADLSELHLAGVRYQDTGIEDAFSRFLEGRVSDGLMEFYRKNSLFRTPVVKRAELAKWKLDRMRGLPTKPGQLKAESFNPSPGVYVLVGHYWNHGAAVRLRFALRNFEGKQVSWSGRVDAASIPPNFSLAPLRDFGWLRANDNRGPIRFQLETDHGKDPSYKIGQKLNLLVRGDREFWLYCYYRQSDGKWFKIFPNEHHKNARLAGGLLHTIPGETTYPFDWTITDPAGIDFAKCFATKRDVTAQLPKDIRQLKFGPLQGKLDSSLLPAFAKVRDAGLTEASLVITVTK